MTRSIMRKPQNLQKFSFPSQTKYSHPSIIFVQGVNPYLQIFFQISKKMDPRQIPLIRRAERMHRIGRNFYILKIFCFSLLSFKVIALILQITNNECLRGIATRTSQFLSILVLCDPCCYLPIKS